MREIISNGVKKGYTFKGMSVSAYASPDGELSLNENLAKDRAKSGSKALMGEFKKNKNKEQKFGKEEANYKTQTTAEDWAGFKTLMVIKPKLLFAGIVPTPDNAVKCVPATAVDAEFTE